MTKEKLKTLKDIEIDDINEWECSNCDYMNVGDNPYCYSCDRENYDREELKKEIKKEVVEELKTLKDLGFQKNSFGMKVIFEKDLKAEAVKWVKEDYKECYSYSQELIIKNWMKRLDITEEDLK